MYASLFEHNPDGILSLNLEGIIIHTNPSAERILGYTSSELERKSITSILEAHISEQVLQNIKLLKRIINKNIFYLFIIKWILIRRRDKISSYFCPKSYNWRICHYEAS